MSPIPDREADVAPAASEQPAARVRRARFGRLPPAVRLDETVATHDPNPVPDPTAGRDTDRELILRNAAP